MSFAAALTVGAIATASAITAYQLTASNRNQPGLWEALVALLSKAAGDAYRRTLPPEDHHTIPMYLCGADNQELSRVTWRTHKLIHFGLAQVYINVASAEDIADRLIPFGFRRKPEILRFARSRYGREVIAERISDFYEESGYANEGQPLIRDVFRSERKPYITGAKTSCPVDN
jgi:hypothetical protein